MRLVATMVALVGIIALLPQVEANECNTSTSPARACVTIPVAKPASQPGVPSVPDTPYWGTYYLWLGPGHCAAPTSNECLGTPSAPNSGVPLPVGQPVGVGTFGMLYQESNGLPGLQRAQTFSGGIKAPDRMILV